MKTIKLFIGFFALLGLALLVFSPAAADAGYFKATDSAWTRQTENVDENLYIAGGNVSVSGDVTGDIMAAGGNVTVQGSTTADVMLAGGTLNLAGKVGGDTRLIGGNVMVSDSVGGGLVAAAGSVNIASAVSVGTDAVITGGTVIFEGDVKKDLQLSGGEIIFGGQVEGDLNITASNITIEDGALVKGDFNYTSAKEAKIAEGAQITGKINRTEKEKKSGPAAGIRGAGRKFFGVMKVVNLVVTLISSLVVVLIFSKFSKKISTRGISKFGKSALVGFAGLVATPIAVAILFASVLGWMFGLFTLMVYIAMIVLAQIITGIIVGSLVSGYFRKKPVVNWQWTAGGVFLVWLLSLIPFIGWFIVFVLFLVAFGALCSLSYKYTIGMEE